MELNLLHSKVKCQIQNPKFSSHKLPAFWKREFFRSDSLGFQKSDFIFDSAAVTCEASVRAENPVARNNNADRISADSSAHSLRAHFLKTFFCGNVFCNLAVSRCRTERNFQHLVNNQFSERRKIFDSEFRHKVRIPP